VEGGGRFNFIATRQAGAFVLEKMPIEFYTGLPNEAYDGRFLCAKATHRDKPGHSFLLATWHGKYTKMTDAARVEVANTLCEHLRNWCGKALCCVFAGFTFNVVLQPTEALGGFERLDPDENVRPQWAGRWRYGNRQNDIDHMLFYQPPGAPLVARRPRRFRMYDRRRAGLLPRGAGAVTHEHNGALDHDSLMLVSCGWTTGRPRQRPRRPHHRPHHCPRLDNRRIRCVGHSPRPAPSRRW
jgi:hypothetical protein